MSDRNWILDGAAVHVAMIGFDDGLEIEKSLDGNKVSTISAALSSGVDVTKSKQLKSTLDIYTEGTKKGADFELERTEAIDFLSASNPHARPNSDVIRPYINGVKLYGGASPGFIIYFASDCSIDDASLYEQPFERIKRTVFPKYGQTRARWWVHERPRPELVARLAKVKRYLATVRHSKHRLFVWLDSTVLPDSAIGTFANENDDFFGILQSRVHEAWCRAPGMGTQVRERESGFRYTSTTCFETFPFPELMDDQRDEIAAIAQELDRLRKNWLNPPEWVREEVLTFPGTVGGPWDRYIDRATVHPSPQPSPARGEGEIQIGTVRYPRMVARDEECAKELAKRTLTNLYNERPTWLDLAHRRLDEAVFAAYGWPADLSDDALLARLLELNLQRAAAQGSA